MNCVIIGPTKTIFEGFALSVSFQTPLGMITVLPHHQPTAMIISSGKLTYEERAQDAQGLEEYQSIKQSLSIKGGVCYIDQHNVQLIIED